MAFRNNTHRPGIGAVGAYQMGAIPYVTGSNNLDNGGEHTITFPTVTRHITVINHSSNTIRVHFAPAATGNTVAANGGHFIELDSDEDSISMSVRLTTLYISNASGVDNLEYKVVAELTPISTDDNPALGTVGISE
jgi:hypothetical protein|tara:strand:+ start:2652 stop:3059 length:408 start_codon:yes stop_codon:yes gene_type:complete